MGKLLLIDGHSILNRAFYGVPELTNPQGLHTNAVYGFLNIMFKVLDSEAADHLAVAFDLSEPTFRHRMYPEYKGTRKPMPEELHEQVPVMKDVLTAMGVPILTKPGFEADDILGTVAKKSQAEGMEVTILSGDRDLLQLADEHIRICLPKTVKGQTEVHNYFPEDVRREYQVTPAEFIDVKALMGDTSDNVPGVPSIGEKTATSIIVNFHSIENAHEHIDEVKPPRAQKALRDHYEDAVFSKKLVTICTDVDLPFTLESAEVGNLYTPEAFEKMKELGFRSLLARFGEQGTAELPLEKKFRRISTEQELEQAAGKAAGADHAGLVLLPGGAGIAISWSGEDVVYAFGSAAEEPGKGIRPEVLKTAAESLLLQALGAEGGDGGKDTLFRVFVLDLKSMLPDLPGIDRKLEEAKGEAATPLEAEEDAANPLEAGGKAAAPCPGIPGQRVVADEGVAAYLLNPLRDSYGYDDIAREFLGSTFPTREELIGKRTWAEAIRDMPEKAGSCLGYMAYTAWAAGPVLLRELEKSGMTALFVDMEMPVVSALYHMEQAGIRVRREELRDYGAKLAVSIRELEEEIYAETGREFNINSPKQLGEILFGEMHLPGGKKTKTGYSTAAGVLEKLAPEYPFVRKILDYRQVTKLKSTYADGLDSYIREDGRIHGTFNQTITATGRISSTEPNLQNIPVRMELGREIRKVFVPAEGCLFTDADYSQIELRVLAHMSGDEHLIAAYRDAEDIHAITASQVFHVPLDMVTPEMRRNAKAVNFGIVYGISAFGLSDNLSISRKEAMEYIDRYFETYPGVKHFLDGLVEKAKALGYSETMFGRRRPIPELKNRNFAIRQFGERVAMNSPIQGTAADIIKIAMIRVDRRLRQEGLKSRLVLQIHDELLVETQAEEKEEVARILTEEMKGAAKLRVELEIGMKTGLSWFETK
ncbi:DNA polymerase I [Clostridium vitabionis]|uniref:DNA polymerase I n=1 Tax=Clostridium vitabionis TaxID=2784388 RepID=UPI001889DF4A|nr:DNA polymerase I [Clostridium vitabionis]